MTRHSFPILLAMAFSTLMLSACSSLLKTDGPDHLDSLKHWDIAGKISIKTPQDAATGFLSWNQDVHKYQIFITGPLGQGSTKINGSKSKTELLLPGWDSPAVAESPELLMSQYLGWNFPIQDIHYWIKGQLAPGSDFTIKTDDYGMTESLSQHGWKIDYSRFQQYGDYWLPGRVKISGYDHRFILAISKWTVYD